MLRKPPKVGDWVWIFEPEWEGPGTCIHCVISYKAESTLGGFVYKLQETVFRQNDEDPILKTYVRYDTGLFESLEDAARDEAEYRYKKLVERSKEYNKEQEQNKEAWSKHQAELFYGAGI